MSMAFWLGEEQSLRVGECLYAFSCGFSMFNISSSAIQKELKHLQVVLLQLDSFRQIFRIWKASEFVSFVTSTQHLHSPRSKDLQ